MKIDNPSRTAGLPASHLDRDFPRASRIESPRISIRWALCTIRSECRRPITNQVTPLLCLYEHDCCWQGLFNPPELVWNFPTFDDRFNY